MNRHKITAAALAVSYSGASVWALWDRLDAVLLLAIASGLACAGLYLFLWYEAGLLPAGLSVSGGHHGFWPGLAVVTGSALAGGIILLALTAILSLIYDGSRARALFFAVGFPWYLITFFLTIFLPNSHVKRAHHAAEMARNS
jgi:hypothetical protein